MRAIFTSFLLLVSAFVFANNIQLQKVSLTDTNRTAKTVNIKMNISWEHSWRDSINWDAAWIIIKYKEPKDSLWKWKHATLSQSGNNTGTSSGVKIVVPDDLMGAFFYRSQIGAGNISSDNVKLVWNYGAAGVTNIDSVEVRVFATEMVYVPQGSFCLGDGNGTKRSPSSFHIKSSENSYVVINNQWSPTVNTLFPSDNNRAGDDDILYYQGIHISGTEGLDVNNDKIADYPNYPTGFNGFYCMKYKVTQGQYADFLNTLFLKDTASYVVDNFINTYTYPSQLKSVPKQLKMAWFSLSDYYSISTDGRNTILLDSNLAKFVVSRPDRAYGFFNVRRSLSFSDWAGLRPMSELEFEKACRGPIPPALFENVWGNDSMYAKDAGDYYAPFKLSGIENGTEFFIDYNITKRDMDPTVNGTLNGDGGTGPYRVGIFATDTSSRVSSGAAYYGLMDVSKNGAEIVVPANDENSRLFSRHLNGLGILSPYGSTYSFIKLDNTFITRAFFKSNGMTSWRGGTGASYYGFRAVRSAPSDN